LPCTLSPTPYAIPAPIIIRDADKAVHFVLLGMICHLTIVKKRFIPPAPWNRVHPLKFTSVTAKRISLGDPLGVQLGLNARPMECLPR